MYTETLIVRPRSKEQLTALKAIIDFETEKNTERAYNPEFIAKIKQSEEDIKAGRTTKIEPADIWNL